MTDRPILFQPPMVRALLDGRKTQTRRVLNPQPSPEAVASGEYRREINGLVRPSPIRYASGDRLWVREAWRCNGWATDVATIFYRASQGDGYTAMCEQYPVAGKKRLRITANWRPSIHMPRWASRLTLVVTDVRVQRLQDISEADAASEGARPAFTRTSDPEWPVTDTPSYRWGFEELWKSINGAGAWEENPWVAAYTFIVHRGNIDALANRPVCEEVG